MIKNNVYIYTYIIYVCEYKINTCVKYITTVNNCVVEKLTLQWRASNMRHFLRRLLPPWPWCNLTHAAGGRGGRQTLSAQEQALNSVASKAVPAFLSHCQMEIWLGHSCISCSEKTKPRVTQTWKDWVAHKLQVVDSSGKVVFLFS